MGVVDAHADTSLLQGFSQGFCRRFTGVAHLSFVRPAEKEHVGGLRRQASLPQNVNQHLCHMVRHRTIHGTSRRDESSRHTDVGRSLNHVVRVNGNTVAAHANARCVAMEVPLGRRRR